VQVNNAVVFNMVHGALGEDGMLQEYLSHFGIAHTGSSAATCRICADKLETAEALAVRPAARHAANYEPTS
jgi:D-alanine-D-alanine ligase-like ATP-grasp enzyme